MFQYLFIDTMCAKSGPRTTSSRLWSGLFAEKPSHHLHQLLRCVDVYVVAALLDYLQLGCNNNTTGRVLSPNSA